MHFLNVNVYGPTELKSLPHIFKSVYTKWNVVLNGYFVFVYVLVKNSASFSDSVRIRQSGRAGNGVLHLVVSEPRFRWFYKIILKFFVNDFEIVYDMHCIFIQRMT